MLASTSPVRAPTAVLSLLRGFWRIKIRSLLSHLLGSVLDSDTDGLMAGFKSGKTVSIHRAVWTTVSSHTVLKPAWLCTTVRLETSDDSFHLLLRSLSQGCDTQTLTSIKTAGSSAKLRCISQRTAIVTYMFISPVPQGSLATTSVLKSLPSGWTGSQQSVFD